MRLRRELRRSQGVLAARLVAIYKADQPDMLSVILESDGFNDLLVRADYMNAIGHQDSVIVDRVRELKRKSAQKRLLLVVLKSKAEVAVQEIEAKQRALEETRAAIQAREADLAAARKYKYGKLGNVREHRHELEGDLRALQAASAQVTNQLQGSGSAPAGPIRQGGGGYIWPVNGPVVSPFGSAGAGCTPVSTSPCRPAPRSGRRRAVRSRWRAGWAATASTPASSTAVASPRATRTSRRSAWAAARA